jgi:hypothetical protein
MPPLALLSPLFASAAMPFSLRAAVLMLPLFSLFGFTLMLFDIRCRCY